MASVSVLDGGRVRLLAAQGLEGLTELGSEPGLAITALADPAPYVVRDAATDPRSREHPLVLGDLALRFYAAARIVTAGGQAVGVVDVLDHKRHRRVVTVQTDLLADLAATVAELMSARLSVLDTLDAERAARNAETDRRDTADRLRDSTSRAAQSAADRARPRWCELGGSTACQEPAEMKIADSWGDSAWGCWRHAEEALVDIESVFLAVEVKAGIAAFRARESRTG
jgi:hypothetical protein